ncbi:NACHT domain-containing protein [Marinifilum fragile]|uniref:NACHT domain-containing protein n=1 Tax=Marinifilum fragile TaxID=570161 RepID=UPI002AA8AA3C|nr:NACHT domain-containing protein [Marinifilum fragile]
MIEQLKSEILKKFGEDLVYTKDCKFLADTICEETGSRISTTTIRRLFGFLKSTTTPAKYTLNILSGYLGYQNWEHFCNYWEYQPKEEIEPKEDWSDFYNKAISFSTETYKYISGQSGIPFKAVTPRKEAEQRIEKFLKSANSALAFIAPGGFGKSTMIAKWFERKWLNKKNDDVVLFLNASMMISFLNADFKLEDWLQDQLKFTQKDSLKYFLEHPNACESRIIFVIDALDEITYDNFKLERVFLQLKQFILNFKDSGKVKLILTSRNTTWQKFAMPFVFQSNALKDCWYDLNDESEKINEANIPPLSHKEIQRVFEKTLNLQYAPNVSVDDLTYLQKKVISNPFFLELFIKLFSPNNIHKLTKGYELMREYVKNKVYYSRYSEEKIDILYSILDLINHGKEGTSAKKLELRERYPIHLKTAGDYYAAYQELLSFGIITEYISTNKKNNYCKYVKITNEVLFETLIGISLIEKNGELNFELIKNVDKNYQGYELKNRLVSYLLESAFLSGKHMELKNLFELSDDTISAPCVLETIFNSSIYTEKYKFELIQHLAENKKSEKIFSKAFSDTLNIKDQSKEVLEIFAKNGATKNLRIRSLSLLLMSAIFSYESDRATTYYNELAQEEADTSCSGFTIAIRLAAVLMYNHFIGNDTDDIELLKLFYYREMAYLKYAEVNSAIDGEFELILCMALTYMESYHKVLQLVDDAEHLYKSEGDKTWSSNYRLLQCYKIFAQYSLGMTINKEQIDYLLNSKSEVNSSQNYYLQIYYNSFLSTCYQEKNKIQKVEEFFNKAIELSEFANYHSCTASLYRKMARFYNGINEKTKEQICISEETHLLKKYASSYTLAALLV